MLGSFYPDIEAGEMSIITSPLTHLRAELRQLVIHLVGDSARVEMSERYDITNDAREYFFRLTGAGGQAEFRVSSTEFYAVGGEEKFIKKVREAVSAITPSGEAVGL
jgi:hypothetical protein